jgi:putative ABC transport system permease protein
MKRMNDVRFGLRLLAKSPGSTLLIISLLALGTGANGIIFGLFDAILLRPLPVRSPERLVRITQHRAKPIGVRSEFPLAYYEALEKRSKTLEAVAAETEWSDRFRMSEPAPSEAITVTGVTSEFFKVPGTLPIIGRYLQTDDAERNSDSPAAVVSYKFWTRRFADRNRAADLAERRLTINGHRFAIVGVMPRNFHGLSIDSGPDVWIPLATYSRLLPDFNLRRSQFSIAGRLGAGVSPEKAKAECRAIWGPVMLDYYQNTAKFSAGEISQMLEEGIEVDSLRNGTSVLRERFGDVFALMMGSVILVSVIVALNVAGLLHANQTFRQSEMAIRLALGGSYFRIVRQLFVESLLLSLFGTAGGLLLVWVLAPLAVRALPPVRDLSTAILPISLDTAVNWHVFLFLLFCSLGTTILFMLGPVLNVSRLGIDQVLRSTRASRAIRRRQVLIVGQIALCTALLSAAGLLVKSFERLTHTRSGFSIDSIVTFRCDAGATKDLAKLQITLLHRVQQIPGVAAAAISAVGVLREHGMLTTTARAGQKITHANFMNADANRVSPDYFETMGLRLLSGRR